MQRRSRRPFSPSVGKSKAYSVSNVRQYSRKARFELAPVERRSSYIAERDYDVGNAWQRRIQKVWEEMQEDKKAGIVRKTVIIRPPKPPVKRSVSKWPRRPRPLSVLNLPRALTGVLVGVSPMFRKMRDAVICARRQVRRELVFASGAGGSKKRVGSRVSPSTVRC